MRKSLITYSVNLIKLNIMSRLHSITTADYLEWDTMLSIVRRLYKDGNYLTVTCDYEIVSIKIETTATAYAVLDGNQNKITGSNHSYDIDGNTFIISTPFLVASLILYLHF